ncbi:MAG: response regulator [bacterium]
MPKKILVIDDEPHIVKIIASRLKASGYEVVTAADGEEALKKTLRECPDLVLVDILMPKMDGYTYVKEVRKNPDIKNTPIIVLTAKDKMKDLLAAEGVSGYLVKPCRGEELLKMVKDVLPESKDKE